MNCAYTAIPNKCLAIPTSTYMYFVIICALETALGLCVQAIRHIGKIFAMIPMIVDQAKSTKRWVIFKKLTYLYQYCSYIFVKMSIIIWFQQNDVSSDKTIVRSNKLQL